MTRHRYPAEPSRPKSRHCSAPRPAWQRSVHPGRLIPLAAIVATGWLLPVAAAQTPPGDQVTAARAQMQRRNFDSAAALLRGITTDSTATAGQQAEAWMWAGVVRYYLADDSGAARAFRRALVLDPEIDAAGLAHVDPALDSLFRTARVAARLCGEATPCSPVPVEQPFLPNSVHSCFPKCERGLRRPVLLRFAPIVDPRIPVRALLAPGGGPGFVVVRLVVSSLGQIELGSVRIVTATTLATSQIVEAILRGAEFKPGTLEGRPARVAIQLRYECTVSGGCSFR